MPSYWIREYIQELPRLQAEETLRTVYAFRLAQADTETKDYQRAMQELQEQAEGLSDQERKERRKALAATNDISVIAGAPVSMEEVRRQMLERQQQR